MARQRSKGLSARFFAQFILSPSPSLRINFVEGLNMKRPRGRCGKHTNVLWLDVDQSVDIFSTAKPRLYASS